MRQPCVALFDATGHPARSQPVGGVTRLQATQLKRPFGGRVQPAVQGCKPTGSALEMRSGIHQPAGVTHHFPGPALKPAPDRARQPVVGEIH